MSCAIVIVGTLDIKAVGIDAGFNDPLYVDTIFGILDEILVSDGCKL